MADNTKCKMDNGQWNGQMEKNEKPKSPNSLELKPIDGPG